MKRSGVTRIILFILLVFGMAAHGFAADSTQKPADSLYSMFSQGTASGKFRTLFFNRDFDGAADDWKTLGIGGQLKFETAPLKGFSMGLGFKTGQGAGLNSDDDSVYVGLLPSDAAGNADNYSALDEYFLRYKGGNTTVTVGAQPLNTPDMDGHYIRLTEKKYKGIGISNKSLENFEFQAYYITEFIGWTDEDFQSITSGFTGDENDDEGAYIGGITWTPGNVKLDLWDYYYKDVMNRYSVQAGYVHKLANDALLKFNLQYLGINDIGDALAGDIDTFCLVGSVGIAEFKGFSLTGILGTNGNDSFGIPFGGSRPILMQVSTISQAEQDTMGLKLEYNFDRLGIRGLSCYVFYADINSPDEGANASPDITEVDFSLLYRFSGWAEKTSLWVRYAIVDKDESVPGGVDANDFRIYLNFSF